jgi:hypothetical protein
VKNIIIVGDSFCASPKGWPIDLANRLELHLISQGIGGASWWPTKQFIDSLHRDDIANTEVIVFVHTNFERIPTDNLDVGRVNFANFDLTKEIDVAVKLYFKHIHNDTFLIWAGQQWFKEISVRFADKKVIHLHSFPYTLPYSDILAGTRVLQDLYSISVNEVDFKTLFGDTRYNHLNTHNNHELANQLYEIIKDDVTGNATLDLSKFQY